MNLFLWGALPYIAFTFLIVGTLVRFFYFERNWTTKSSEFLEKKQLRIANPLFHSPEALLYIVYCLIRFGQNG